MVYDVHLLLFQDINLSFESKCGFTDPNDNHSSLIDSYQQFFNNKTYVTPAEAAQ
jgi:hypothetical protein